MVFGLMDFLMGGKKKGATSKVAAVSTPNMQAAQSATANAAVQPDGVNNVTPNVQPVVNQPSTGVQQPVGNVGGGSGDNQQPVQGVQFVDSTNGENQGASATASGVQPTAKGNNDPAGQNSRPMTGGKKSISEVIHKLHGELGELKERSTKLVTNINDVDNRVTEIGHKVESLEENKKINDDKMAEMEENMTKFLSLYELINNQYNPFIDKDSIGQPIHNPAMSVSVNGHANHEASQVESHGSPFSKPESTVDKTVKVSSGRFGDLDSALLELDTLNIEEAAGDAVPLTQLKNNTNSLVVILSWLEYMIKRVGIEETRNSLRYYTEVLRWITPEVFFDLDKYLRGMKDKKEIDEAESLGVKDHIVSLYFISKLNEKKLDEKLTTAVLQIIKE